MLSRYEPTVEGHGQCKDESHDPDHQHDDVQRLLLPQPLGQEGPDDGQPAVQAHQADQIDRYIHVDAAQVVNGLAHSATELPAFPSSQKPQEERGAQEHQGVSHGEVQDQEARHGASLDTTEHRPHHEEIPGKTKDEGKEQDGYPDLMGEREGCGGRHRGGGRVGGNRK